MFQTHKPEIPTPSINKLSIQTIHFAKHVVYCFRYIHYTTHLASRVRAITPETMGVAALVPPKPRVHPPPTDVDVCIMYTLFFELFNVRDFGSKKYQ